MKLKDLIEVMDTGTVVCICDDMGPITDVVPLEKISVKTLIDDLDREVTRVYFDTSDNSITIELEDYKYEEGND
jgi:hypothetical protein